MSREPRPHEAHLFNDVYLDETSQTGQRFFAVGGVVIPREYSTRFEQAIMDARGSRLPLANANGEPKEIKWGNCKKGDFDAYKQVVDAFFDFRKQMEATALHSCKFHCSVVDTHVQGRSYSTGKKGQLGFSREIYFHCLLVAISYYPRNLFYVYPDERPCVTKPREAMVIMNRGTRLRGDRRDYPFRRLLPRCSHEVQAIQVSDILLGALVYRLNKHYDAEDASEDKRLLSDHVLTRAKALDLVRRYGAKSKNWGDYTFHVRKHPEVKRGPAAPRRDTGGPLYGVQSGPLG
jgi:hypothetical protein